MNKIITLAIAFLLFIPFASINGSNVSLINGANGNILYVGGNGPNNYTSITEALGDASNGDTIFVYPGTYHERLSIHKSINLISKNRNTTIIDGGGKTESTISIYGDFVTIEGFTVRNGWYAGIYIKSNYSTITKNNLSNNGIGVALKNSIGARISANIIISNDIKGIKIYESNSNNLSDNFISDNCIGIGLSGSIGNIIANNTIIDNDGGIYFSGSNNNRIYRNDIILNNNKTLGAGLFLEFSFYNIIHHNNFIMNYIQATFTSSYMMRHNPYTNNWDGNYWGRPRILPKPIVGWWAPFLWLNFDWHPAMQPYGDFTLKNMGG